MDQYASFLAAKAPVVQSFGVEPLPFHGPLFDFQRAAAEFAIRRGRAALFLDTGLGKTIVELEFAHQAAIRTGKPSLILTPLAVARQIERESIRFGYHVRVIRDQGEAGPGINICNYDRVELLDADAFGCVVLDESSILKNFAGKTTRALIAKFAATPFRLAATATPAPNDHTEIGNHAEFLGIMQHHEMLMRWFINDSNDTGVWRLKGHATAAFWDWCASWAVMAETPDDMGFDGSRHILPALHVHRHQVAGDTRPAAGSLFAADVSATTMHGVKRQTAEARAQSAAAIVADEPGSWVLWVDTDYEADAVRAAIPTAGEVRGGMTIDAKEQTLAKFADGTLAVLIAKSSACGFGLNWQHCSHQAFIGRSFSYEAFYQAVRRCWRFGQTMPVHVHLMVAEGEDQIGRVIERKAADHAGMKAAMRAASKRVRVADEKIRVKYQPTYTMEMPVWLRAG
jgi:hypothetical protein